MRYWADLSLPDSDSVEELEAEYRENELKMIKEAEKKILELGAEPGEDGSLVFKTYDLEEARKFSRDVEGIITELDKKTELDFSNELVSIVSQPECPKCGYLGRFSEEFCSQCGTELTKKEFFD